jgi:hypothetical protein
MCSYVKTYLTDVVKKYKRDAGRPPRLFKYEVKIKVRPYCDCNHDRKRLHNSYFILFDKRDAGRP